MSGIREAASQYIAAGYSVVPIRRGTKRPEDPDWLKRTFTVEDFDDSCNIGIKIGAHSGGLVDVDLDTPEAIVIASILLPQTGMVSGRAGKPSSHFWFRATAEVPSLQFKDLDDTMLMELRSTGLQTVVPPSVHESGEAVQWMQNKAPLAMDPELLLTAVRAAAVATLLARHWPAGSRHVAAGNLAGFLVRCGFDATWVTQIIRAAATAAKDDEVEDRVRFARETVEKHEKGEKTTGAPRVVETFGKELVARIYAWVGREGDDQIESLNATHFVARVGKGMAVGIEEDNNVLFQTYTDFEQLYCNRTIGKKKLGQAWLEHPDRREFRKVVFIPPGSSEAHNPLDYNLWRGYSCEPDPNPNPGTRIPRYLEHLHDTICDGITEHVEFVLDLLADCVQRPGRPVGKALALRGKQGVGKSVFVESFAKALFANNWISVSHRDEIVGKFNSHLSGKIVVFADEAVWGGNKQDAGTLKKLVTQDRINIERKGIDKVTEPNCVHLFLATNEEWVWPAGDRERRGVILDVTRERANTDPYWAPLWQEVESPHFGPALLAFLLDRQVDYTRLRENLITDALREQIDLTSDTPRKWWKQRLDEGSVGWTGGWPSFVDQQWLFEAYKAEVGIRTAQRLDFITKMRRMLPPEARPCVRPVQVDLSRGFGMPRWAKERRAGFFLPTLTRCREWLDITAGITTKWSAPVAESELPRELLELAGKDVDDGGM